MHNKKYSLSLIPFEDRVYIKEKNLKHFTQRKGKDFIKSKPLNKYHFINKHYCVFLNFQLIVLISFELLFLISISNTIVKLLKLLKFFFNKKFNLKYYKLFSNN